MRTHRFTWCGIVSTVVMAVAATSASSQSILYVDDANRPEDPIQAGADPTCCGEISNFTSCGETAGCVWLVEGCCEYVNGPVGWGQGCFSPCSPPDFVCPPGYQCVGVCYDLCGIEPCQLCEYITAVCVFNENNPDTCAPPKFRPCPWDLNGDSVVSVPDLLLLLGDFGSCDGSPADFDGDGCVGVPDLLALIANFGPCPGSECVWDVNGDGFVDNDDLHQVVANQGPCDGCPEDVNGDGVVDGMDTAAVATHFGPCP